MFQKFIKKQKGFTLIELLVAVAVASIVIIGSYMGVSQFSKQENITSKYLEISQSARTAIEILKRDIRMAGYHDYQSLHGIISDNFLITNNEAECCDKIDIIFDKSKDKRIKVSYEVVSTSQNRKKLVKSEYSCLSGKECSTITSNNWQLITDKSPVVIDIGNFQLEKSSKGGDAIYVWGEEKNGIDMYRVNISHFPLTMEALWDVECCNPGIGTDMVLGGKYLYFWYNSKVFKVDPNNGKTIDSFNVIRGTEGASMAYGNNNIYLYNERFLYKYDLSTNTLDKQVETNADSMAWEGKKIAVAGNTIYLVGSASNIHKIDATTLQETSRSGVSVPPYRPYHKSHIRHYKGSIYTLGSLSLGSDNIGIAVNGGKFGAGQCYTRNQACSTFRYSSYYADELIVANDYIYYFAGKSLVLYKKSGGGNTLSASVPCDDRHKALGNNTDKWFPGCDDYNHLRYGSTFQPVRGGTVEFIPNSSLSYDAPYENVKISISFKKTISIDKTVSKDYESSVTVRNYK